MENSPVVNPPGIDCPSATVPSKGISYKDRVTGNFDDKDSNWEEWTEEDAFDPWMIVQRRSRRPVKQMVEKGKTKIAPNQGHESRNRFHSLQGIKEPFRESLKALAKAVLKENIKEFVGEGRKLWKPKKDQGVKAQQKSSGNGNLKALNKVYVPPLRFGPNLVHGPPPGFSFKAGSTKPVVFYPKRLDELVGSSHFGLPHLMEKQSSDTCAAIMEASVSKTTALSGCDDEMCLPSDAVSLPLQQPPSVVEGAANISVRTTNDGMVDDNDGMVSAALTDDQGVLAINSAQSKEPSVLDITPSLVVDGLYPMEQ
ncbi:hypothetical protein COLO4_10384 [Corchorus olitorius]|uniref:Uncharacterized protein n=1 Tax=Corchorus olitorius TaxID=93759 RepID=A0A1R3K8S2_9ROSI|nr:hypothetical protein COLO4_10384 [Corchorus olitorius]